MLVAVSAPRAADVMLVLSTSVRSDVGEPTSDASRVSPQSQLLNRSGVGSSVPRLGARGQVGRLGYELCPKIRALHGVRQLIDRLRRWRTVQMTARFGSEAEAPHDL